MKVRPIIWWIVLVIPYCGGRIYGEVSEPFGGRLVSIEGNGSINLICSGGFIQKTACHGVGDVLDGARLIDTQGDWEPDCYAGAHYVLLSNGEWSPISGNSETELYLERFVKSGIGMAYRIIPFNTLSSMFGQDNSAGFCGGSNIGESDILMPWDQRAQQYAGYYYFNTNRQRWEDLYNNPAGDCILYPDECLVVAGRTDRKVLLRGRVQLGSTSGHLAAEGGVSIVPNPYPFDIPIADSGLEDTLKGAQSFMEADWLMDWDSRAQAYRKFYYYDSGDKQWRDLDNNPIGLDDRIRAGEAVIIIRNSPYAGSWTMEQTFEVR